MAWVNEKAAPELLDYAKAPVTELLARVIEQVRTLLVEECNLGVCEQRDTRSMTTLY